MQFCLTQINLEKISEIIVISNTYLSVTLIIAWPIT